MDWLGNDWNPYEVLLQCQADIEALQQQQQHQAEITKHQAKIIQQLSQNFLVMVKHLEHLEKRVEELNER